MEDEKNSSVAAPDLDDNFIEKKFEEILEKKLPEILEKTEELKKKKAEQEEERAKYVKKIWSYFPGAKTKKLSFEEAKDIAEKLEELAQKVGYTPVKPREAEVKFFGGKKRKARNATIITLIVIIIGVAVSKFLWGW